MLPYVKNSAICRIKDQGIFLGKIGRKVSKVGNIINEVLYPRNKSVECYDCVKSSAIMQNSSSKILALWTYCYSRQFTVACELLCT